MITEPLIHLDPSAFVADPDLLRELEKWADTIQCGAGKVLFRQGEPSVGLYIVDKGEVTMSMVSDRGRPVLSMRTGERSLLGLPGVIGNEPYTMTATTEADCAVSFVAREDFFEFMGTESMLAMKILEVLASEVRTARKALSSR
jgi:CRP-like cAMP-binding protein